MVTRKRAVGPAVGALILGTTLIVAGCGAGSNSNPSVASLGGSTATSTASGSSSSDTAFQAMLAYSQCMRSHGVPNFPDPQQSGGKLNMKIDKGNGIDPNSKAFQDAQKACKSKEPRGKNGSPDSHVDPTKVAAWMQCLRSHGLPNLPDPTNTGNGLEFNMTGGNFSPDSQVFQNAMNACKSKSPGGGIGIRAGGPRS